MADACDINNIFKRFMKTGQIDHVSLRPPMYGDFTSTMSFQEQRNAVIEATQAFELLPHEVRTRFGNDPANLVDFMADDANIEEAKQLGLYEDPETDEPAPAEPTPVVDPPPEPVAPVTTDT